MALPDPSRAERSGSGAAAEIGRRIDGDSEGRMGMRELVRTNNPALISWLTALLADAGIETVVLDMHTSIMEGSIGAIPRRLMVTEEDLMPARRILRDAGEDYST